MRLNEPRVEPLDPDSLDEGTRTLLEPLRRTGGGRLLNVFATLAHHPKLLKRWSVFGNHVLSKSTLLARDREILILRTAWLCRAEYEWGQHVAIGRAAGLSDDEIRRIADGPEAGGWEPFEATLVRAADELHGDSMLGDTTWKALGERYDTAQILDLVFTVGQYNMLAMALNSLGVQLDDGIAGFPSR